MDTLPFVRVVVINFDGGQLTIDCLESLLATEYPADLFEIVLVDNGSLDDVVERVGHEFADVRVIESLENTGFAGGCNLGIRAPGRFDHVALVNNDATVAPGWLRPLVDALAADPGLGAACPKILFAERYQDVELEVTDAGRIGSDPRSLGVRVSGMRLDGDRAEARVQFDEGFHLPEVPYLADDEEIAVWSTGRGRLHLQVADGSPSRRLDLRVSARSLRTLILRTGADEVGETDVFEHRWTSVALDPTVHDVINNVGSNLYVNGFAGDRGFLELDRGQFDEPADVFAWCGGGVLLSGRYLDEVGLFDERLFLYYEDTDLSWRGRLAGWNYRYEPASVLRHRHAQSSGVGSPTFRYYTERNRVLVLAKNAPAMLAVRAAAGLVRRFVGRAVRDLVVRPLTLRLPAKAEAAHQWRVLKGVATGLPAALHARRNAVTVVDRASLMSWETTK